MACDENYILDANGKRILIGLTLDETREFERLDELIISLVPEQTDELRSRNERRWLVLYDKNDAAVRLYLANENAKALRALRWDWACK
jgi:hypothetical protein